MVEFCFQKMDKLIITLALNLFSNQLSTCFYLLSVPSVSDISSWLIQLQFVDSQLEFHADHSFLFFQLQENAFHGFLH